MMSFDSTYTFINIETGLLTRQFCNNVLWLPESNFTEHNGKNCGEIKR